MEGVGVTVGELLLRQVFEKKFPKRTPRPEARLRSDPRTDPEGVRCSPLAPLACATLACATLACRRLFLSASLLRRLFRAFARCQVEASVRAGIEKTQEGYNAAKLPHRLRAWPPAGPLSVAGAAGVPVNVDEMDASAFGGSAGGLSPLAAALGERWVAQNRPVILRGALRGWPPLQRWSDSYLRSAVGGKAVPVRHSPQECEGGRLFGDPGRMQAYESSEVRSGGEGAERVPRGCRESAAPIAPPALPSPPLPSPPLRLRAEVPLSELLDELSAPHPRYYAARLQLRRSLPELLADLDETHPAAALEGGPAAALGGCFGDPQATPHQRRLAIHLTKLFTPHQRRRAFARPSPDPLTARTLAQAVNPVCYLGAGRQATPMHFDPSENLLCVVQGAPAPSPLSARGRGRRAAHAAPRRQGAHPLPPGRHAQPLPRRRAKLGRRVLARKPVRPGRRRSLPRAGGGAAAPCARAGGRCALSTVRLVARSARLGGEEPVG